MEIPLTQHMRYVCPECGENVKTYSQFLQHLQEKHDYSKKKYKDFNFQKISNGIYQCLNCMRRFVTRETNSVVLQLHYITHLPSAKVYSCLYCAFATVQQTEISAHLKSIHHKELKKAPNKSNLDYRNAKCNPEFYMRFQCPLCKQIMNEFDSWLKHINKAHKSTSTQLNMKNIADTNYHYCHTCKRMFFTNDHTVLQRHRFTHLPYPNFYRCAYCAITKATKLDILRHFIEKHRRIFDSTRQYIKKPIEWGKQPSSNANDANGINNNVRYVCFECETEFDNQKECHMHIASEHQFETQKNFRRLKSNYYQCLKCKQNLMCNRVDELRKHYYSHIPYRSYLKCLHCSITEQNHAAMLSHLKDECTSKPLSNKADVLDVQKIPPPLNLFTQPYDYQQVLNHLRESHANILKISADITN